jgi:hypothetical protein
MSSKGVARQQWDDAELETLFTMRNRGASWQQIADRLPERTADAVRNEFHRLTKQGTALPVQQLPATPGDAEPFAETTRARTTWTKEDDIKLLSGLHTHGKQWRRILTQFPGRTDSSVRNRAKRLLGQAASMLGSGKSDSDADSSPCSKASSSKTDRSTVSPRSVEASPRVLAKPSRGMSVEDGRRTTDDERTAKALERRSRSARGDDSMRYDAASLSDSLRALDLFEADLFSRGTSFPRTELEPAGAQQQALFLEELSATTLDELSGKSTGSLNECLESVSLDELASITASLQQEVA